MKLLDNLFEKPLMLSDSEPFDVFENSIVRMQFGHDPYKLSDQLISRIVQLPLSDHAEALAWRAAEHDIDGPSADSCSFAYFASGESDHRPRNDSGLWEVERMYGGVDRVDFDRCNNIEASLLETKRHAARARK
jgi:hypothetical protein